MLKILIFFGLLFGVFYFFYYKIKKFFNNLLYPPREGGTNRQNPPKINKGEMVKCPACDTYFPENTGYKKGGKLYCSEKCADKG